jgi:hypothetical protein
MRRRHPFILLWLLLLCCAVPVLAHKVGEERVVCPFSRRPFLALVEMSGTQMCQRFDFKPVGYIGAPSLVPICPDHGFAIDRELFNTEVEKLRPWVESPEFRRMAAEESPYYRIAQARERLSAAPEQIAFAYLSASWQVEEDPPRYQRYIDLAVRALDAHIAAVAAAPDAGGRQLSADDATVLAAELERRLGRFDAARTRLATLDGGSEASLATFVQRERELIDARDAERHYLSSDGEARCAELDRAQIKAASEWKPGTPLREPPEPTKGPLSAQHLRP